MTWLKQVLGVLHLEAYKSKRQKGTKVIVILYLLSLLALIIAYFAGSKSIDLAVLNTRQILEISLSWTMSLLLPFAAIYLTTSTFQKEFTQGTIKNLFLLPIDKSAIYAGKMAGVGLAMAALLGLQFVLTAVFSLFVILVNGGFGGGALVAYVFGIGMGLVSYLSAWIVLVLIALIISSLALLAKNMGLVIAIGYLGYVALGIAGLYIPRLSLISINSILGNYANILTDLSISQLLVVFAYYTIGACAGYYLFEKKEAMVCPFE